MRKLYLILFFLCPFISVYTNAAADGVKQDTIEVKHLNRLAYDNYRDNARQSIKYARQGLTLAKKINFIDGIAEANRMLGVSNSSLNNNQEAIGYYLTALEYFKQAGDLAGQLRVYGNIGNEYQEVDYDKALEFLTKALDIAIKLKNPWFLGPSYLNVGNVYYRKKEFTQALNYYRSSENVAAKLKDTISLIVCRQNEGVIYFNIKNYDEAEKLLTYANAAAKQHDLNKIVAEVNLTLTSLYTAKNDFVKAQKVLEEGESYATLVQSEKLLYDYMVTSYELEYKQHNYKQALDYLHKIYRKDSVLYKSNVSVRLNFMEEQFRQQDKLRKKEFELQEQSYNRYKFIAATIVAGLMLIVILLLVGNVKSKAETNKRLTELNAEVNFQKDNLDKINHHLEEIIDERTRDLQDKNTRLSEYSSYLSHQIRGPIATLKGLLNLQKEDLLSQRECLAMMDKCVSDIDDKIISISEMLHDAPDSATIKAS